MKVVKVFCHEEESEADFDRINEELFRESEKANKLRQHPRCPSSTTSATCSTSSWPSRAALFLIGGVPNVSVSGLAFSISIVVPFLNMTKSFAGNIGQVSHQVNAVVMGIAGRQAHLRPARRGAGGRRGLCHAGERQGGERRATSSAPSARASGPGSTRTARTAPSPTSALRGDVRLFDVDFELRAGQDRAARHHRSTPSRARRWPSSARRARARRRSRTCINRFYDIADGKIRYDGININEDQARADLRRALGIVLQDTNLFTGTVMENIRYGTPGRDGRGMHRRGEARRRGRLHHPPARGLSARMLTGDGANLSQGQRQLISIARAAVADPPVMILDEATSSIDTRTEAIVQRGMDALMQGRTVFVIAHRLSHGQELGRHHGPRTRPHHRARHPRGAASSRRAQYYQLYTGAFELE